MVWKWEVGWGENLDDFNFCAQTYLWKIAEIEAWSWPTISIMLWLAKRVKNSFTEWPVQKYGYKDSCSGFDIYAPRIMTTAIIRIEIFLSKNIKISSIYFAKLIVIKVLQRLEKCLLHVIVLNQWLLVIITKTSFKILRSKKEFCSFIDKIHTPILKIVRHRDWSQASRSSSVSKIPLVS